MCFYFIFTYKLRIGPQAYDRIKSKRSKIAADVLLHVKSFFATPKYKDQPKNIKAYVKWALKPDGPAFYLVPTPEGLSGKRYDENYIVCIAILSRNR